MSFITDDDEFNRDDELDDEFSADKKLLSPDAEFSARLSDAEAFKGFSRHSSVSAEDDDDDNVSENKDPFYFVPSSDADHDRCDLLTELTVNVDGIISVIEGRVMDKPAYAK